MSALDHAALGRILDAMPLPAAFIHADGAVAVANRFVAVPPDEPLLDTEAVADDPARRHGVDGRSVWTIRQITDELWLATDEFQRGTDGAIRRFIDGAPDLFVVLDREFRVLDSNASFGTSLGWDPDACNGVSLWSLVADLPAEQQRGVERDLANGEGVSIEVTMVCRDGGTRMIRWRFEADETHRVGLGVALEREEGEPAAVAAVAADPVAIPVDAAFPTARPTDAVPDSWTGAAEPPPPTPARAPDPFSVERRQTPQLDLPDPRLVAADRHDESARRGPRRRRGRPAADEAIAELLDRHGRVAVVVLELDRIRSAPRPAGVVLPAPSADDPVRLFDGQVRAEAVITDLGDRRFAVVVPAGTDLGEIEVLERRLAAAAEATLRANVVSGAAVGDRGWAPATLRTMAEAAVGRSEGVVEARHSTDHGSPDTTKPDEPVAAPSIWADDPIDPVAPSESGDVGSAPAPTLWAADPALPTVLPLPSDQASPMSGTTPEPNPAAVRPMVSGPAQPRLAPAPVAVADLLASTPTVRLPKAAVDLDTEADTHPGAEADDEVIPSTRSHPVDHDEELRRALIVALERGEFVLRYQPVVALDTGRIRGVEALLRWQRPDGRLLGPDAFLDVAEEAGLLVPLGARVIEEAARTAGRLVTRGHSVSVAVNLSSRQLHQPDLVPHVRAALDRCSVDPSRLIVEVTEATLTSDSALVLARLRDVGVNVAIDDFGVGSSSLGLLRDLPLDAVKLDGSLVDGLETHEPTRAIASAVVSLGAALGLVVVMEGIETPGQADQALRLGCELGQGSLYHWPTELATIERMLDGGS